MADVQKFLQSREPLVFLEQSDWLSGDPEELERVYQETQELYQELTRQVKEVLGPPCAEEPQRSARIREVLAEVSELVVWERSEPGFLWLGWGQHDRESPVFIACGWLGMEEAG